MTDRLLGLDAGSVRVGAALSDPTGSFALPLEVIDARQAVARVRQLVEDYSIKTIVIGMPLTLRGEHGPQAREVALFIQEIGEALAPIPVIAFDERLTSKEADRMISSKKGKRMRDALAAAIMLESYMRTQRGVPRT